MSLKIVISNIKEICYIICFVECCKNKMYILICRNYTVVVVGFIVLKLLRLLLYNI